VKRAQTDLFKFHWNKCGHNFNPEPPAGEDIDLPTAQELFALFREWQTATTRAQRTEIWKRVLEINAEETFSIGIVCCTKQPVVVSDFLKNVPEKAVYAWNPGAQFGVYLPDTFYFGSATKP
ncbi:MAG: ABC transporter substrate-binding protein, partial [Alphaproteobacteria bacterium]